MHLDTPGVRLPRRPRLQREARDGCDARQRFAAKTQRENTRQVLERVDLAGRMPGECQGHFRGIDADAVIPDADQAAPAALQFDLDPRGAGVESVLDEFLDHRGGSFDDLAGGNLTDERVGK